MKSFKLVQLAPVLSVLMCLSLVGAVIYKTVHHDPNKVPPEIAKYLVEATTKKYLGYEAYRTKKYAGEDGYIVYEVERDTEVKFSDTYGLCSWYVEGYRARVRGPLGKWVGKWGGVKNPTFFKTASSEKGCDKDGAWISVRGFNLNFVVSNSILLWDKWAKAVLSDTDEFDVCAHDCDLLKEALKQGSVRPTHLYLGLDHTRSVAKGHMTKDYDPVLTIKAQINTLPSQLVVLKTEILPVVEGYQIDISPETKLMFVGLEDGDVDSIPEKKAF